MYVATSATATKAQIYWVTQNVIGLMQSPMIVLCLATVIDNYFFMQQRELMSSWKPVSLLVITMLLAT